MHLLASVVALAAASAGLTLEISTPRDSVLVGEPVKLVVRWRADRPLRKVYIEREDFTFQSLRFRVAGGSAAKEYTELPHSVDERILVPGGLEKGDEVVSNYVLLRGSDGFLFPSAGQYSVAAVYQDKEQTSWKVLSNAVRFNVREATGDDRAVFAEVKRDPAILSVKGDAESQAIARRLVERHPESPYLRWARIELLRQRANALHNRYDPDTREPLFHLDKESFASLKTDHHRRMAQAILDKENWGQFQEEALDLALLHAEAGGDQDTALKARRTLFEKYPRSATVKRIKEEDAEDDQDDEPMVGASPKPKH